MSYNRYNITDSLNFLSKFTFRKFINAAKIVSSYHLSKLTHKPYHWGLPISIAIEPTTHCNLRCPECPSGLRSFTRPTGTLDEELFKTILDELYKDLAYLTFYFQGEPYLHPKFLELVKYASGKGIYTATSTNAHFLDDENAKKTVESGLDRLIISIDGTTQETYSSYRVGGKLDKVLKGANNIVKWKKKLNSSTPSVIFQFLVVKPNEHQIEEIRLLGKETGVDEVRFKTAQVYDYEHGNPLIPTIDKYSRYKQQSDGTYTIKNELLNHCWKLWHSCVITWDGLVVPCCFDKDAEYRMGDLKTALLRLPPRGERANTLQLPPDDANCSANGKESFKSIWNNEKYRNFRSSVLLSRGNIEMCTNCTEGTKVWA